MLLLGSFSFAGEAVAPGPVGGGTDPCMGSIGSAPYASGGQSRGSGDSRQTTVVGSEGWWAI